MPLADVLIIEGLQLPVMPFMDVDGNAGAAEPWQRGPIGLKIAVILAVILIFNTTELAAH